MLEELDAALPSGVVVRDPDILDGHARDQSALSDPGRPLALVRARSRDHVQTVLRLAQQHRVPVVPQGARTGLSGGAAASDGAILLSVLPMDEIVEIDEVHQIAVVQPGTLNADLSRAVEDHGLFYPPDPASWAISTIGGNVATNAGGLCCVKYGVTRDYVLGLEVVLPGGEVIHTGGRTAKNVAGYDLTHLVVGSEGTLGVVTEVTLRLVPLAEAPLTAVASFESVADAAHTVADVMAGPVRPSLLEILDRTCVEVVTAYRDVGLGDAGAVLLMQSDRGGLAAQDLAVFAEHARGHGATEVFEASDPQESEMLLEFRRVLHTAFEQQGLPLSEDVCVPRSRLPDLMTGVEKIAARTDLLIGCGGHAGDGNVHPIIVFDPADPEQKRRAYDAFDEIMALGLSLGGTITGEHGVGVLKAPWLEREIGPVSMEVHRRIKAAFDPHGIMNPGKILPSEEQPGERSQR